MILSGRNLTLAGGNLWLTKPVKVNSQETYLQLSMLSAEHPNPPHFSPPLPCSISSCQIQILLTNSVWHLAREKTAHWSSDWNTAWLELTGQGTPLPSDSQNPGGSQLSLPLPSSANPSLPLTKHSQHLTRATAMDADSCTSGEGEFLRAGGVCAALAPVWASKGSGTSWESPGCVGQSQPCCCWTLSPP